MPKIVLVLNDGKKKKLSDTDIVETYIISEKGFKVSGVTGSPFLKADGTVDTSTYYILPSGGTATDYIDGTGTIKTFPVIPSPTDYIANQDTTTQVGKFKIDGAATAKSLNTGFFNIEDSILKTQLNRRTYGIHLAELLYFTNAVGKALFKHPISNVSVFLILNFRYEQRGALSMATNFTIITNLNSLSGAQSIIFDSGTSVGIDRIRDAVSLGINGTEFAIIFDPNPTSTGWGGNVGFFLESCSAYYSSGYTVEFDKGWTTETFNGDIPTRFTTLRKTTVVETATTREWVNSNAILNQDTVTQVGKFKINGDGVLNNLFTKKYQIQNEIALNTSNVSWVSLDTAIYISKYTAIGTLIFEHNFNSVGNPILFQRFIYGKNNTKKLCYFDVVYQFDNSVSGASGDFLIYFYGDDSLIAEIENNVHLYVNKTTGKCGIAIGDTTTTWTAFMFMHMITSHCISSTATIDWSKDWVTNISPDDYSISDAYKTPTSKSYRANRDWVEAKGYLTTELDPTVPTHVKAITTTDITVWNGKQDALGFTPENIANKGVANGYVPLNSANKIDSTYLSFTTEVYKGTWNASTNTPAISDSTGTGGWKYRVIVGGTIDLGSGSITFTAGDDVIHNGTKYERVPSSSAVTSVDGLTGDVDLTTKYYPISSNPAGYLTTESDPTVGVHIKAISTVDIDNWNSATTSTHTHSNKALLDTYDQTNANIANAVALSHEHSNLMLIETYTQSEVNLSDAVSKRHTHPNKALLDTYDQANSDIADAVSLKHEHSNLSLLETYDQTNLNISDAVSKKHTHSNYTLIEGITEGIGLLRRVGGAWEYDTEAYLTTEIDPTVPSYAKSLTAFSVIKAETDLLYDKYISWKLQTNTIDRTTVKSGEILNLVQGANTTISYSAGGTVNISSTDTTYTNGAGLNLTGTTFSVNFGTSSGTVSEGNHNHTFASLVSKPTTVSGYGIVDVYTKTDSDTIYQPKDADLTSIADLTGTTGLLRKVAANIWTLDTTTYLTDYTETDPTVPTYSKSLTGFSVIKTDTDLLYDKYTSWQLQTNSINRTTIKSGEILNLVEGDNTVITYSAGGTVTISSSYIDTKYTGGIGLTLTGTVFSANFGMTAGTIAEGNHTHTFSSLTATPTTLSGYGITDAISTSEKGAANGVAPLGSDSKINSIYLPSYVDDVIEAANLAALNALPASEKQTGKIYVALDTNITYRWGGSTFIEIASGAVESVNGKTGVVTLTYTDVGAAPTTHTHVAGDITSGVFAIARIPTGTTGTTVALGNHTHTFTSLTSKPTTISGYGITDVYTKTETDSKYQPKDNDLTAIAGLTGTTGILKKTAADTWTLDTSTYVSTETDPIFTASPASGITTGNITSWNDAATKSHEHINKVVLDTLTTTDKDNWNVAYSESHTHANKSVLDGTEESFTSVLKAKLESLAVPKTGVISVNINSPIPTIDFIIAGVTTRKSVVITACNATAGATPNIYIDKSTPPDIITIRKSDGSNFATGVYEYYYILF